MENNNSTKIVRDLPNRKILVTRYFDADLEDVWKAWTETELLDQWWSPKPWKMETKSMDFREGGSWVYAMVGPDGTRHWSKANFTMIKSEKSFKYSCYFVDENENILDVVSSMNWYVQFSTSGEGTMINVELSFNNDQDVNKMIEMGFEGGFSMGLDNLNELLIKTGQLKQS